MRPVLRVAAAIAVVVTSFIAFAGPAAAHERRMVGPYQFVVGFISEPAFAGTANSLDLRISDTRSTPAKAIEGLEKTLTATVQSGGLAPLELKVTARFGQPGAYNGYFMPTAAGTYIFDIKGKIETLDVNEKFESGPGRFNDVESTGALQYPMKVPTGSDLSKQLSDLQGAVDQTRIFALAALVLGVIAVGSAAALTRRRA